MAAIPPTPATPISGAQILVQCLVNHGVDIVFAYPGGASMPIHQALTRVSDRLRTILPRHEQGGGFAAQGYARSTGKVGVCLSTSGPGATNFVTCLADAKLDSCPIIAITGQVSTADWLRGARRPGVQERHPDCGVRQAVAGGRGNAMAGDAGGVAATTSPADRDDLVRLHLGRGAASTKRFSGLILSFSVSDEKARFWRVCP